VTKPTLFETFYGPLQMKLFDSVEALGEDGCLKALEVGEYALRKPREPSSDERGRLAHLSSSMHNES